MFVYICFYIPIEKYGYACAFKCMDETQEFTKSSILEKNRNIKLKVMDS